MRERERDEYRETRDEIQGERGNRIVGGLVDYVEMG